MHFVFCDVASYLLVIVGCFVVPVYDLFLHILNLISVLDTIHLTIKIAVSPTSGTVQEYGLKNQLFSTYL